MTAAGAEEELELVAEALEIGQRIATMVPPGIHETSRCVATVASVRAFADLLAETFDEPTRALADRVQAAVRERLADDAGVGGWKVQ